MEGAVDILPGCFVRWVTGTAGVMLLVWVINILWSGVVWLICECEAGE